MRAENLGKDIEHELISEAEIQQRLADIAREIEADYTGEELVVVGILRGAVMVVADLVRYFDRSVEMDWMAVSSYGAGTKSSGVVKILKDLDMDITGRNVLIVEDIVDSGLTLAWLKENLRSRGPKSVEIVTLLRKPEALQVPVDVKYVGFDVPDEFVVGYGLDFNQHYRNLRSIVTLAPHVYS